MDKEKFFDKVVNLNKKAYEGISKLGKSISKTMIEPTEDFSTLNLKIDKNGLNQTIMDYFIRQNLK